MLRPFQVKHYYVTALQEHLYLGTLVNIHATHVSPQDPDGSSAKYDGYFISIFPERDATVLVVCLDQGIESNRNLCRIPLGYYPGLKYLRGIKSLSELMAASELKEGQVFRTVVAVKSVGPRRKVCFKTAEIERVAFTVEVVVRDRTDEASISLWEYTAESVRNWKAGETILLLSNPNIKEDGARKRMSIGPTTSLEIDPDIYLAAELKIWAKTKHMEESANIPFPAGGKFDQ